MTRNASVFISYSHGSDTHREFVRSLADDLRRGGLDCQIDQYVNGFPPEGWQRWMENQIEHADFVLIVCTLLYLQRYRGMDPDSGRGVNFKGVVISQTLYGHYYRNTKFIPVIPEQGGLGDVPLPLKGYTTYKLPRDYTALYRLLTDQPATPAPEIGEKVALGESPPLRFTSSRENKRSISDTMKAAYIGAIAAVVAALKAYQESLAIRKKLVELDSAMVEWQTDLVVSYFKLLQIQIERQQELLTDALAILYRLQRENRLDHEKQQWIGALEAFLQPASSGRDASSAEAAKP